jgi:hypothetical protein
MLLSGRPRRNKQNLASRELAQSLFQSVTQLIAVPFLQCLWQINKVIWSPFLPGVFIDLCIRC